MSKDKDKVTTPVTKEIDPQDALNARLDEIEKNLKGTIDRQAEVIEQQNKAIEELKKSRQPTEDGDDDAILVDRKSAHTMRLPVVNDAPVIDGKLERVVGVAGLEYLMKVKTADGKSYSFPFGSDVSRIDFTNEKLKDVETIAYENVKSKNFPLQDIDNNDLTGASKIEKGKIVGEGGVIPEVDRSSGRPQLTGRKIRTVVRQDVRYYTIEYNGKKFTLSGEKLGRIRI
jgi:hypothetical protein